jgi:LmbE family N-acetylglucosaminyl deacetylase
MNPYQKFVSAFAQLATDGKSLPLGGITPPEKKQLSPDAPVAMIFSPHPDDECIIGGLALRLMREAGMRVVNVAVTLGSNQERRAARLAELKNACDWIGFELEETGLEKIDPKTREAEPQFWQDTAVMTTGKILYRKYRPKVIFFPHQLDWNTTHIGTHLLIMDALKSLPADFKTTLIETEFWGQMQSPNLMAELSAADVSDLIAALSFHVGEVQRNPYHLRLPAWLQDNVRRGSELVGGKGTAAPDFGFATLYRAQKWENGGVKEMFRGGKQLGAKDLVASILD